MSKASPCVAFEIRAGEVRAVTQTGAHASRRCDPDDPAALGEAIKGAARDAGVSSGPSVVGVGRTSVVLKTIALPPGGLADHDRPAFVRLQMDRQLPFPADRAAIDFVDAPHEPPALLAAALRSDEFARLTAACADAGFRSPSIGLIDEGLARLMSSDGDGASMGVFVTDDRCEIIVARGGRLLMSRACDLAEDDRETVVTEARRTLMSYRVRSDASPITSWTLADEGDDPVLIDGLDRALELGPPSSLADEDVPVWALRLRALFDLGEDRLDFAAPTVPPDRNARKRQGLMLAALVALALVGTWMTLGLREKRALTGDVEAIRTELGQARTNAVTLIRAGARLDHAQAWLDAGADWNAHFAIIGDELPGADQMLLDRLDLRAESAIDYNARGSRVYSADRWIIAGRVEVGLTARASSPDVARSVREALIALDAYTLTPLGEDAGATGEGRYPVPLGVALTTSDLRPERAEDTPGDGGDTDG